MTQPARLFENIFSEKAIIPARLLNFGSSTLNHLTVANTDGEYTALITSLSGPLENLADELGDVDTSLAVQKGTTLTNDQVMQNFIVTMRTEEPFIARALEGSDTPAYLQFYPQGISEYNNASKTSMGILTNRVNVAATQYADVLGTALTTTLQGFETSWLSSRNTQQQQMGNVDGNRSGRSEARTAVELALMSTLHTIAAKFPGQVEQCSAFFDFSLLYPQGRRRHLNFSGIIAAGGTVEVLNRTLTDHSTITLRNPDDNAAIAVWLAATASGALPAQYVEVQPGHAHEVKPSALGSLQHTFLMVQNLSSVNEGAYEVVVV